MALITREEILGCVDLPTERVPVPEWGTDKEVLVRGFSVEEQARFEKDIKDKKGEVDARKAITLAAVRSMVDEAGNRIFADEDATLLEKKSMVALGRINKAVMRINKMRPKDMEELLGN